MPNWCENKLVIGNADAIAEFESKYLTQTDDGWEFDFKKVIPPPKSISDIEVCHSAGKEEFYQLLSLFEFNSNRTFFDRAISTRDSRQKAQDYFANNSESAEKAIAYVERFLTSEADRNTLLSAFIEIFNDVVYGCPNWYEWNIANWGTKWSSRAFTKSDDPGVYYYDTAWSPPMPLLERLASQHPTYQISGAYMEPSMVFAGKFFSDCNGYLHDTESDVREVMLSEFGYSEADIEEIYSE